jgi:Zn-dependent metalloprotease
MGTRILALSFCVLLSLAVFAQQEAQPSAEPNPSSEPAKANETAPVGAPENSPKPDLTPDANGKLSQEQMQQLFRVVAAKDLENDKLQRNYTYIERRVENRLDKNGETKSREVNTYEVLEIYGEQVERLIAKDDKPLSAKDAAKEEEKIQKIIDKRKNESEEDRRKREEKEEKQREDDRKFTKEVADAYDFKLGGPKP